MQHVEVPCPRMVLVIMGAAAVWLIGKRMRGVLESLRSCEMGQQGLDTSVLLLHIVAT